MQMTMCHSLQKRFITATERIILMLLTTYITIIMVSYFYHFLINVSYILFRLNIEPSLKDPKTK